MSNRPSPEIEQLVKELLREDSHYDRVENRTAHRDHLVRAVEIVFRGENVLTNATAFSRNISAAGIGIITSEQVPENAMAVLTINRLSGKTASILSECRWCKPYGNKWFITGWRFVSIQR